MKMEKWLRKLYARDVLKAWLKKNNFQNKKTNGESRFFYLAFYLRDSTAYWIPLLFLKIYEPDTNI
jgi:hypothetical protein